MDYIQNTPADAAEMLKSIGVASIDDLFAAIPEGVRLTRPLEIPAALPEQDLLSHLSALAARNRTFDAGRCFLGAGAYNHFTPSIVKPLITRGEFLTSYTPYQAEVSQGTLQTLYEFQSMICELMAMDVCNAGMYEGASALAEAVLLALRETGRKEVLIPHSLHPDYKAVVRTYTAESDVRLIEIPHKQGVLDMAFVAKHLTDKTAAIVVQNPNFLGIVDDHSDLVAAARCTPRCA